LKALVVLIAIAMAGCTAASQSTATPTPIASASPIATNSAESKAADFRIRLDLLLGEHVMIIAKQSSATARPAEYTSYLRLLTTNGADLIELVRSAMGDSVAARFAQIWNAQNDNLVTYAIGLAAHDKTKAAQAMAGIAGTFIPQFSQFISDVSQIPTTVISPLLTRNMLEMRQMLDDQISRNYSRLYADIRSLYAHAIEVGDAVAPEITGKFPDKFPGNATGPAANTRASLNVKWQEHSYLTTMRTSAIIAGRSAEQAAVAGALVENTNAIDPVLTGLYGAPAAITFDHIWAAFNAATVGYASASTTTAKQRALGELTDASVTQLSSWLVDSLNISADSSRPELEAQLEALVTVIDEQRAKSWSKLGGDDRAAETTTEVVAELIAAPAIAKLPPNLR
jgi:hypothetical protein